jgi:hypothetical protein
VCSISIKIEEFYFLRYNAQYYVLQSNDVSKEYVLSIFMVEEESKQKITLSACFTIASSFA